MQLQLSASGRSIHLACEGVLTDSISRDDLSSGTNYKAYAGVQREDCPVCARKQKSVEQACQKACAVILSAGQRLRFLSRLKD